MFIKNIKKSSPMHLAAITYSLFRSCRTSVLIILAILIQLVIPITKDRLNTFAFPRMACRKITVKRFGMLSRISVALMSSISSHSGAMPLTVPNMIAIPVDITVAAIPINRDCVRHTRSWKKYHAPSCLFQTKILYMEQLYNFSDPCKTDLLS